MQPPPQFNAGMPQQGAPMVGRPLAYDIAVIVCWSCDTSVVGDPAGGHVVCPTCGTQNPFKPRQSTLPPPQSRTPGPQDPALRAQDGRPLLPPPSIAFLWEGHQLPPHRLPEALVTWKNSRRRAAGGEPAAGEEVVMLVRELMNAAEKSGDLLRARALLEASLEVAPLPRHRAVLLGSLTRLAVRQGDIESAFRFSQHFDPQAPDLESDSEWRVTTALVATARGDYPTVLAALGSTFEQYAIQDALDPQAALYRANALEKSGQLPAAVAQLQQMFSQGGPAMRAGFERMASMYPSLQLCQASLAQVVQKREAAGRAGAGMGKIMMGLLLMGVPLIPIFIGLAMAVPLVLSGELLEGISSGDIDVLMPALMPIGMGVIFTFAFGLWGLKTITSGLAERRAYTKGVRTTGKVLSASPTGVQINDVPEMRIDLEVQFDPQQPPVRTSLRKVIHPSEMIALQPGTMIHVRVDPSNPSTAILDQ